MEKIKIHPLFLLFCLLMLLLEKGFLLGVTILSVAVHEFGHYYCAQKRGFCLHSLTFMPYGAVMYASDGLPDYDAPAIAFAGPFSNILLALIIVCLWWFFPVLHAPTEELFYANLSLGLYNLLPCYPLDGGRMVLAKCKNKTRALVFLRIIGLLACFVCIVLFIVGFFFSRQLFFLPFCACMFLIGATADADKEKYRLMFADLLMLQEKNMPLEEKVLFASDKITVRNLLKIVRGEYYFVIHITKGQKIIRTIKGADIEKLFYCPRHITLGEALSSTVNAYGEGTRDRSRVRRDKIPFADDALHCKEERSTR